MIRLKFLVFVITWVTHGEFTFQTKYGYIIFTIFKNNTTIYQNFKDLQTSNAQLIHLLSVNQLTLGYLSFIQILLVPGSLLNYF